MQRRDSVMPFWNHLDELRSRLMRCLAILAAGSVVGIFCVNRIIDWIAKPVGKLVFITPVEAFTTQMKVAVGVGFLIGLPVLIYHVWAFVGTGLRAEERHYLRWAIPISYLGFMAGAAFSVFFIFPRAIEFLLTLRSARMEPLMSVEAYVDFFGLLGLAFGGLFQLPLVLHFLAKMGILQAGTLTQNRRVTYLILFILATIFNPVPEVFTQLILGFMAIGLFEASVVLVRWENRKDAARLRTLETSAS